MKRFLVLRLRAQEEINSAATWYAERSASAAVDFVTELEECIRRIQENPLAFPVVHRDLRRAVLRKFPYILIYKIAAIDEETEDIILMACFHTSRNPDEWRQNLN